LPSGGRTTRRPSKGIAFRATNPAARVRGPKYTVKKGKTPVSTQDEARELLEKIDTSALIGPDAPTLFE
jgi:hypothetical protein